MPDYDHGYKPDTYLGELRERGLVGTVGCRAEDGGHDIDWSRFDRKVDRLTKDELRYALKKEARLRADTEARRNEVL